MASESKSAVLAAMGANFGIAVGKFVAGGLTGSAVMLAEAAHSVADTVNQVFLLVGINLSDSTADENHPHGYGKEPFFWSFLAAIFIFVAGATFSLFEGTRTLLQDEEHHRTTGELAVAFGVLGLAFVFESVSAVMAVRAVLKGARARKWSIFRYLREAPDPTTKTVFFEDGAALTGLAIAAAGLALSEATGNEHWDGVASIGVGIVLAIVALILGLQARSLLLGAAAHPDTRREIHEAVTAFPEVEHVVRLLTMQLGTHSVLVTGELQVRRDLDVVKAEDLLRRIDAGLRERVPEVQETFWELRRHPEDGSWQETAEA